MLAHATEIDVALEPSQPETVPERWIGPVEQLNDVPGQLVVICRCDEAIGDQAAPARKRIGADDDLPTPRTNLKGGVPRNRRPICSQRSVGETAVEQFGKGRLSRSS